MAELNTDAITTEAEYEAVLVRINSLWGSMPNTPEYRELNDAVRRAEEWEITHYKFTY
ncbi:MAG: transcriptional regulator [Xanthomonadales bacterium]|nr:transcriptional regulator [Xanthomonadales bacterium]